MPISNIHYLEKFPFHTMFCNMAVFYMTPIDATIILSIIRKSKLACNLFWSQGMIKSTNKDN